MSFSEVALRAAVVFLTLFIWSRILGRKLISQMKFFDFVTGVTIGSLGASFILNKGIVLANGILALTVYCSIALVMDMVSLKSGRARRVLDSGPVTVLREGNILDSEMSKSRLTYNDLLMLLRKAGVFYPDEVELAVLETDGTLSVQRKNEQMPVSRKDAHIVTGWRGLPHTLIVDGQILPGELAAVHKDKEWVAELLRERSIDSLSKVALAQIDQNGDVYIGLKQSAQTKG